jgi:hypothetical protein
MSVSLPSFEAAFSQSEPTTFRGQAFRLRAIISTVGDFVPGYEASGWQGIGAPANTPTQIIAIRNKLVNEALAGAEFKARFVDLGLEPYATSPAEFGKFCRLHREMGQGDPGRQHQDGLSSAPGSGWSLTLCDLGQRMCRCKSGRRAKIAAPDRRGEKKRAKKSPAGRPGLECPIQTARVTTGGWVARGSC